MEKKPVMVWEFDDDDMLGEWGLTEKQEFEYPLTLETAYVDSDEIVVLVKPDESVFDQRLCASLEDGKVCLSIFDDGHGYEIFLEDLPVLLVQDALYDEDMLQQFVDGAKTFQEVRLHFGGVEQRFPEDLPQFLEPYERKKLPARVVEMCASISERYCHLTFYDAEETALKELTFYGVGDVDCF